MGKKSVSCPKPGGSLNGRSSTKGPGRPRRRRRPSDSVMPAPVGEAEVSAEGSEEGEFYPVPRDAGNAPQRLRLPPQPRQQLRPRAHRSVRARHDDREVRPARRGHDSAAWCSRAASNRARGCGKSSTSTACRPTTTSTSRRSTADADQPRDLAAAGDGPRAADHARDGPADAAGQGPAGPDRRPAAHRQDDPAAAHQPGHLARTIPTSS